MTKFDYIALSVPVFFLLMGIELLVARRKRLRLYRASDTIADLGCGVVQQLSTFFFLVVVIGGYRWVYENARITTIPETSIIAWVALFFGVDFFYYWFHRLSHEVNFMWAAHVVHHQSEEYNLAVALRQSAVQPLLSWVFYLPLAVFGFPPLMFGAMAAFSTLYQFWIHTRLIGKLGPLEWIFNTPSHHRVHHGRNPEYIDKNHAATLIIWDRMFGTFAEEKTEVVYGVTEPLTSWNPVWANFHYWRDLFIDFRRARTIGDKIRIWFKPPGWRPSSDPTPISRSIPLDAPKYDLPLSGRAFAYVAVQFLLVLAGAVYLIFAKSKLPTETFFLLTFVDILGFAAVGAMLDGRRWTRVFEPARLALSLGILMFVVAT